MILTVLPWIMCLLWIQRVTATLLPAAMTIGTVLSLYLPVMFAFLEVGALIDFGNSVIVKLMCFMFLSVSLYYLMGTMFMSLALL